MAHFLFHTFQIFFFLFKQSTVFKSLILECIENDMSLSRKT